MTVGDIHRILEAWAPKQIAWERDNIGLQVGEFSNNVRNILVAIDVTDEVLREAQRKKIDIIISHHPLLFHPLKTISGDERIGRLVKTLIQNNIALYTAHTNLDYSRAGVSFTLAEQLGLQNIDFLLKKEDVLRKVAVFVPDEHAETLMIAMAGAGAGHIGKYEQCSFRSDGTGTFKGSEKSKPTIGTAGKLERVSETRLEMIVPSWKVNEVLRAMYAVHPYEEVAYDVYSLTNPSNDYGSGAIGELKTTSTLESFLNMTRQRLNTKALRYSGDRRMNIKRVAVCGGSGSELLQAAIEHRADAFVTADIRYHSFQEPDHRIALIDAGHYETEHPVVQSIVRHIRQECNKLKKKIHITASTSSRNPVQYYLS